MGWNDRGEHHEGEYEETAEERRENSAEDVLHAARLSGWFLAGTLMALDVETMRRIAVQLERYCWFELPHVLVAPLPIARLMRAWDDYTDRDTEAARIMVAAENEARVEFETFQREGGR